MVVVKGTLVLLGALLALAQPAHGLTIRGDRAWVSSAACPEGWTEPGYDASGWGPVEFPWLLIWPSAWELDPEARPFWEGSDAGVACTRRAFELPAEFAGPALARVWVDDDYKLWINGHFAGESKDEGAEKPGEVWDLTPWLHPGRNVIALELINTAYEKGALFSLNVPGAPEQPPSIGARLFVLLPWAQFAGIIAALVVLLLALRAALRHLAPRVTRWSPGAVALLTLGLAIACQYVLQTTDLYKAAPELPAAEWMWSNVALVAALLVALFCLRDADATTDESGPLRGELLWLGAILLLGTFLRVWRIDSIPVGFYQDEATNGLDAQLLMDPTEAYRLWSDSVGGRPTLFLYALGIVLKVFGASYLSLKVLPIAVSVLAIAAVWAVGRVGLGPRAALWAAFFVAVSRWDIHYARMAWEVNCVPLFSAAGFAFLLRGLKHQHLKARVANLVLSGIVLALGLYTYAAYRAVAAGAALFLVLALLSPQRQLVVRNWRGLILAGVAAGCVALPLVLFSLEHPELYWERYRDVSLTHYISYFGTPLPWLHQIGKGLLSFNHLGDELIRHNLPKAPHLDTITCVFFLLGLTTAARASQQLGVRLLWSWLLAFIALASLTRDAPHATRYLGMVAPAVLFAGFGAARLFARLRALLGWAPLVWPFAAATAAALLALNAYQYFVVEAYHPNADFEMNLTARVVCERVAREQGIHVYWSPDVAYWAGGPCHFLARGRAKFHELKPEVLGRAQLEQEIEKPALIYVGTEFLDPGRGLVQRDENDLPRLGLPGIPFIQRDREGRVMFYVWEKF